MSSNTTTSSRIPSSSGTKSKTSSQTSSPPTKRKCDEISQEVYNDISQELGACDFTIELACLKGHPFDKKDTGGNQKKAREYAYQFFVWASQRYQEDLKSKQLKNNLSNKAACFAGYMEELLPEDKPFDYRYQDLLDEDSYLDVLEIMFLSELARCEWIVKMHEIIKERTKKLGSLRPCEWTPEEVFYDYNWSLTIWPVATKGIPVQ